MLIGSSPADSMSLFDRSVTWKDIAWLKSITKLPIVLKGVLTAEDALLAVECGCAAILVSNHGARQLDTVSSTIEALPEVVAAVAGRVEVYVDGGVRRGIDVFKALALGARAVFIGRPVLWGLAHGGQPGVEAVHRLLHNELELAMGLAGTPTLKHITRAFVTTKDAMRPKF
jgi:isopentenyl diphosphate isomerase/L-lactate dehydrogenase-like FMN-dependent dehydrogenase